MKRASLLLAICVLFCAPGAPARAQSAGDGLCAPAARLEAGQVVSDSTAAGEARMEAYPGVAGDFAGPELVYLVQPGLGEWHTAQVAAPGAGLRLVLLEEREEDRCRAADAVQAGAGSLSFLPRAGASYYLVVDGPAAADFTVALDCPGCANPRPWVESLLPGEAFAPAPGPMTFTALGGGFAPGATALLDGDALETRWLAAERLEFDIPAALLARAGTHRLSIDNPGAAGRESAPRALTVEEPPGSCAAALDLVTGRRDERSTASPGSSARFSAYSGVDGSFPGAEMVYRVWNEAGGITSAQATPALDNAGIKPSVPACLAASGQPVLFVIGTLGDSECGPTHLTGWGVGSVTWDAIRGVTYYVVVESSTPAPVRYHLELRTNLRRPDDGTLVTSAHPRFDWPEASGASHYVLRLSRSMDGHAPFATYASREPHLTVPANLSGIVYWTVSAYDGTQHLSSLPVWPVRVYPVSIPGLLSPANGARVAPGGVTLRWSAARVARTARLLEYEVQVARDADFSPPVTRELTAGLRSRPSLTISDLPGGARYYWRVRAVGSDGPGEWSAGRSFLTAPPAPALVAPADGLHLLQGRVFLAWDAAGAGGYVVQVSGSASFRRVQAERMLRDDHVEVDLPAGTWYWRARVNDPGAPWSAVRSFRVP